MEAEFKREMNRSYMVLRPEAAGGEHHAVQMLTKNRIPGLLPFQEKRVDGDCRYYYDITSKQPLARMLEYRKLSGTELRQLTADLLLALRQMESFLLDESQLCLKPDMIYVEPASFRCYLCLVPGRKAPFPAEFCGLSQFLLDHINHQDGEAVLVAFSIFKESRKENFGIEDIEACLRLAGNTETARPEEEREADGEQQDKKEEQMEIGEAVWPEKEMPRREAAKDLPWKWLVLAPMIGIPILAGVLLGLDGLLRHKWMLGAGELLLITGAILLSERKRGKAEAAHGLGPEKEAEEWAVYFQEEPWEEPKEETKILETRKEPEIGPKAEKPFWEEHFWEENEEQEMQTMLLTGGFADPEARKLVPVKGGPEIPVQYFPFLIGKNKEIVDFCIDLPEVSRLHLKLEKLASGYAVTDLNSTNGTRVNGHLLTANETYPLVPGDELAIAAAKYRFL